MSILEVCIMIGPLGAPVMAPLATIVLAVLRRGQAVHLEGKYVDLSWENRGLIRATVGDRELMVGGEALLDGDPDFLVYAQYLKTWSDGAPLTAEERAAVLDDLVEEARRRGWKFEVAW